MRLITCAGFYATGSSAVTDFFGEFDNVFSMDKYEYRFIQDPHTISDLEYNIVENNHRHNTSHAIKEFKRTMKSMHGFMYRNSYDVFGKAFDELTDKYINEITELKTKSWWHVDRLEKGTLFVIADMGYSLTKRLLTGGIHTEKRYSLLSNREEAYYSAINEKDFLKATRKLTEGLFTEANKNGKQFVMVDQLVPPTNVTRYTRYFNDIKVIVVDRDPRDVYLIEKEKIRRGVIPIDSVEDYVKWFKITRRHSMDSEDSNKVVKIHFEDLIYHYNETTKMLCDFVGISEKEHVRKKLGFDPKKSVLNTNLKKRIMKYDREVKYIEEQLSEYLYPFPEE